MKSSKWLKILLPALVPPVIMTVLMAYSSLSGSSLSGWGILPLQAEGLPGILLAPLVHTSFDHLFSNIIPFFFMTLLLFYFYEEIAWQVLIFSWIFTGILVWLGARESYHLGASGVVYSLAAFHVLSGIIRKNPRLLSISLLMVFLYGGMIWGVFPDFFPGKNISWESHLSGLVTGMILAVHYRSRGPQSPVYSWDAENEDSEDDVTTDDPAREAENAKEVMIRYIFKEKKPDDPSENS
ncbi:MAG: rhomboid family intramembrane serine protease [Bacteroidales bacterium]